MSLVYVKNKNNGVTYVYESSGFWDKNKQQAMQMTVRYCGNLATHSKNYTRSWQR